MPLCQRHYWPSCGQAYHWGAWARERGGDPAQPGTHTLLLLLLLLLRQVLMDIFGVLITCLTCQAVLVEFADCLPL
jgi:hypothetical protein